MNRSGIWDYENGFYWFSSKTRLNKLLAHYELYKTIATTPGHIFELGVNKGSSLVRFCTFRDALENDYSRKIVGFDCVIDTMDNCYVRRTANTFTLKALRYSKCRKNVLFILLTNL